MEILKIIFALIVIKVIYDIYCRVGNLEKASYVMYKQLKPILGKGDDTENHGSSPIINKTYRNSIHSNTE